jgi:hypothetical protein
VVKNSFDRYPILFFVHSISRRNPGSGVGIDKSFGLLFGAAIHQKQSIFWPKVF